MKRGMICTAVVAMLAVMSAGCSPGVGDVSGTVKYKSKAPAGSTITFFDGQNKTASSVIGEDGNYVVKNVGAGPVKIAVISPLVISMPGMQGSPPLLKVPEKFANH